MYLLKKMEENTIDKLQTKKSKNKLTICTNRPSIVHVHR